MKYPFDFERVVGFDGIRASIAQRCKYPSTQFLVSDWEMQTTFEAVMLQLDLLDQIHQLNELSPSVLQFQGEDIQGFLPHLGIENFYLEEEALAAVLATTQTYQNRFSGSRPFHLVMLCSIASEMLLMSDASMG